MPAVKPPFRADHVGSLLRADSLKAARVAHLGEDTADTNLGPHGSAALRAIEDRHVREVIALQERVGLRAATDGELRRRSWWLELVMGWDGFKATRQGNSPFEWRDAEGAKQNFSLLWITGRIGWQPSSIARAFEYLRDNTRLTPKVTLPAPQVVHIMAGCDRMIEESWYGDVDAFWEDLVAAYRQEIAALADAGARFVQIDDVAIAFLCDPALQPVFESLGRKPADLLAEYARRINQMLDGKPDDMVVAMHQCRGNREGLWAAEGGYDAVAEVMFNEIGVDAYYLEYDTARAGDFAPLRHVPAGKVAMLGMVSTKTPEMETKDALKRRFEAAAKAAPIERLGLTTQCGFASSVKGNPVSEADEEAKLALIVETAREIWADA